MSIALMTPCSQNSKASSLVYVKLNAKANSYSYTDTFEDYNALLFVAAWGGDPSRLYIKPDIGSVQSVAGPYSANFIVNGLNNQKVTITFFNLDSGYNSWHIYGIKNS